MSIVPLVVVVVLVFGGTGVYVGFRVVNPLGMAVWARWIAWALLLLPASLPFWFLMDQLRPGRWLDRFMGTTYLLLGLLSFLFVITLFRDWVWLGVRVAHRLLGLPERLPETHSGLQTSGYVILVLAVFLSAIAIARALSPLELTRIELTFDNLHPDLQSFKLIQLSDLHLGLFRGAGYLSEIVDTVNKASPDLVVVTGDLTDGSVEKLGNEVLSLTRLKAPVLFVTGNHEYYWTPQAWIQHLEDLGVRVLTDSVYNIRHGDAKLAVVGVSDPTSKLLFPLEPSGISLATRNFDPSGADLRLLLAHRPGTAYQAVNLGFDLQLSGHTHGGQFFPWNHVIHLVQPFASGLYRHKGTWIYCSRGSGFWGPPMRLGVPAEITEITFCTE